MFSCSYEKIWTNRFLIDVMLLWCINDAKDSSMKLYNVKKMQTDIWTMWVHGTLEEQRKHSSGEIGRGQAHRDPEEGARGQMNKF